jgi:hypothetical protein
VLEAYFDLGHFWRDISYVMGLGLSDMVEHQRQALRISKARNRA